MSTPANPIRPGDFDLPGAVGVAVAGADSAVRFAIRLATATGRQLAREDGYLDSELAEAQERLGVVIPELLRRLYETIGRRGDLIRVQDRLLPPHQLSIDLTGRVLEWRVENQGCAWWGIPLGTVTHEDPPVLVRAIDGPGETPTWYPYLDRLSLAIVEMLLSEFMFTDHEGIYADNRELDEDSLRVLETHFERLRIPDCPMWTDPSGAWCRGGSPGQR